MARPDPLVGRPRRRGLGRYLLDGERIVVANHRHWAMVAMPVAAAVAGLILVLVLDSWIPANLSLMANLFWWAWFFLVGRAIWKVLEWRNDWFVATDKRLILTYGLITQKIGMMPLAKVTDMSYTRSPLGRLCGYGTFVMESAGLDQALHRVRWVAQPDHTYRAICAEMFGVDDHERVVDQDAPAADHTDPDGHPNGPEPTDSSRGIRIRAPGSRPATSEPHENPIREGDTGPMPYWSPTDHNDHNHNDNDDNGHTGHTGH